MEMPSEEPKRKKPVMFIGMGKPSFSKDFRANYFAQGLILKAMSEGITDPKELQKMAGLKTAADLYHTLDKLAIRKEYHAALDKNGLSLDKVVQGIKQLAETSEKDSVRLNAWLAVLKSLGVDRYQESTEASKPWEQLLIDAANKRLQEPSETQVMEAEFYEVNEPKMPEEERSRREEEKRLSDDIYGAAGPR